MNQNSLSPDDPQKCARNRYGSHCRLSEDPQEDVAIIEDGDADDEAIYFDRIERTHQFLG